MLPPDLQHNTLSEKPPQHYTHGHLTNIRPICNYCISALPPVVSHSPHSSIPLPHVSLPPPHFVTSRCVRETVVYSHGETEWESEISLLLR